MNDRGMIPNRVYDWVSYCEAHGLDPVEELKRRRQKFWTWVGMLAGCVAFWAVVGWKAFVIAAMLLAVFAIGYKAVKGM